MDSETPQSNSFYEFLAWVELNKQKLVLGAIVVVVVGFGIGIFRWRASQRELAANQALLEVNPPGTPQSTNTPPSKATDYLKVAADYAGTAAAERALLLAAGDLYVHTKYQEAQGFFESFLKNHSDSPLAVQAAMGVATCLDALNKTDEALAKYQDVVNRYSTGPGTSQARLAMARIYEAKNQPEQALKAYDELTKAKDFNVWNAEARTLREALLQKHPNLAPTNAPVSAATPPGTITIPMDALTNKANATAQTIVVTNQAKPAPAK